jgi:sortase A
VVDAPSVVRMPVAAPPVPCPCIIRVSSRTNDEVATAPIDLVGHPSGPRVDPSTPGPFVVATITARERPPGFVGAARAELGGPVRYEVTVAVRNRSTVPLRGLRLTSTYGRGGADILGRLELASPDVVPPGQTWRQTVVATVPAPSVGTVRWRLAVSGAGEGVEASSSTRQRPVLLLVALAVLVVDLALLGLRWCVRRRVLRTASTDTGGGPGEPGRLAAAGP